MKTLLFCILYTGGSKVEKVELLYDLMEDKDDQCVFPLSQKFLKILQDLVLIPTVITGDVLAERHDFETEMQQEESENLMKLYTSNYLII